MKPSDFFIGVIDFFSVILPGAVLTFFLKGLLYTHLFGVGKIFPELHTEIQKALAFLVATYILGNLIFPVGSFLLDKFVYDRFLRNLFKRNFDLAYLTATRIRDTYVSSESEINHHIEVKNLSDKEIQELLAKPKREVINTFKWAQKYLALKPPAVLTEIQKLEADSKFFRSLAVVFVIIGGVLLFNLSWWGVGFLVLALLSIYRYGDLRYKSTEYAYEQIIAINHLDKLQPPPELASSRDNRSMFLVSHETVNAQQTRIAFLTKGVRVETQVLAIPPNETWNVTNSSATETVMCCQGEGYCIFDSPDVTQQGVIHISQGGAVTLPMKSNFKILNSGTDMLIMLCARGSS